MNIQLSEAELAILRSAIPILNKLFANPTVAVKPEAPKKKIATTTTTTNKDADLGLCQYVNRKVWKDIHSMEELDNHSQRCTSKACETHRGVRLCTKHKRNDIEGLLKAINNELTKEERDEFVIPDHVERTHVTEDPTKTEEVVSDMNKEISRIYQQSKYETYNCKYEGEECFVLVFDEGVAYVMDVLGLCIGKLEDEAILRTVKTKHKQRMFYEVKSHITSISDVKQIEILINRELCTGIRK